MYITPALSSTEIAFCQPIAASGDLQYNEGDDTVTGGLHDGEASDDGLVKGFGSSIWEEDWSR